MANENQLQPAMDEEGLEFFKAAIDRSRCFLEYGCGGSTAYAANSGKVKSIISTDTSKEWIENVKKSLSNTDCRLYLTHCDLGELGEWGTPINRNRSQDFWQYMTAPWSDSKRHKLTPDTILIDGRFRVASFLYSLVCSRVGTLIMFDDYFDRPQYFVVERFVKLKEQHGRMGVFYSDHTYSIPDITAAIAEYSTIWD